MSYVIVGNSAAGLFAAEEIRRHDTLSELIILTAEQEPSYSRCLTTYFLAGDIPLSRLYLRDAGFAERLNLRIFYGVEVNGLDSARQVVRSTDGREWHYGKLLLAMGASANKPKLPGGDLPEVFTLRTMQDALAINSLVEQGARKAVVIGGGLVSLKTAYALRKRGLEVSVLVSSAQILSQMLDGQAAGLIQERLEANGVRVCLQTEALAIAGLEQVESVQITSDTELAADLVVVGKGVRPNLENLRACGLQIGRGLQVDSFLATNLPHVYAAGDIAETWDLARRRFTVNATWPNAAAQGRIAGANMCGTEEVYPGSLGLNSADFFGLSAVSAGITKLPEQADQDDWRHYERFKMVGGLPIYQSLICQGDILRGFVLVGDTSQSGVLTALIKAGQPLAQKDLMTGRRGSLLAGMVSKKSIISRTGCR